MTEGSRRTILEVQGDPGLAAILERVASILSDIHLDSLAAQREFGEIFASLRDVPDNLTELQRLDALSQTQGDLAAFLSVLARDVANGTVDNTRLRDALRLGRMRHVLLDEPHVDADPVAGDVALF